MDGDRDGLSQDFLDRVATIARGSGLSGRLDDLSNEDWERLLGLTAQAAAESGTGLPNGWQDALGRHRDRERLRADQDDAELAARGEVFAREDDA